MTDENGMAIYTVTGSGGRSTGMDDGYAELAAAIVKQAVVDYEAILNALFKRPKGFARVELEAGKAELENFFRSSWYETLTDIDGDKLIEATKRRAVERAKKAIRKQHEKKLKKLNVCVIDV